MRMFGPNMGNRIEKSAQNSQLGVMRNACRIRVGKPEGTDGVNPIDVHGIIKLMWIFREVV